MSAAPTDGLASARGAGRPPRRYLDRLSSIRAKLGFVIVFAVGMTVVLVYLLFGFALRESARDQGRLELLRQAQALADGTMAIRSDGRLALAHAVLPLALAPDGRFSSVFAGGVYQAPNPLPPRFLDGGVHVGTTRGWDYAAVSRYAHGRLVVVTYAVRRAPNNGILGSVGATLGFLRRYWWQLLVGGALAAGIALVLARFLARGMTQPLREMAGAAGEMARGQYGRRVTTESRDEVGQLAAAFNRMAAELEQVERLRRDLVANVSHELKTPISALRAHLENLLDGVEQPNPETLQVMLQQSERLSRLVEQLLDLSRLESGDVPMDLQPTALAPLVDQVVSEVEVAAGGRGAGVPGPRNLVARDLPTVMADAERIHQVLYNLLDNAVRFTPPEGSVEVTAAISGNRCVVTVTDTGTGIPPDRLPFVFERFYRADPARARGSGASGGTGIGLAIVRSIVESHGGRVRAESEPGRGSAFAFDLALAGKPPERDGHAAADARGQAPGAPTTEPTAPGASRPAVGASATTGGSQ